MQSACYIEDGRFYENECITEVSRAYTAPLIYQVLKWLREKKVCILKIIANLVKIIFFSTKEELLKTIVKEYFNY